MKIKLSKNHLDHTAGDTIEVEQGIGEYLVRVGASEEVKDTLKSKQKEVADAIESYSESEEGTKNIATRKTPEQANKEIKKLNKNL